MREFYPRGRALKFLVLLREPAERAWSSYWFQQSHIFKGVDTGE